MGETKVGPQEVLGLTDNDFLELGITTIGDKARLRQRCRLHTSAIPESTQRIERLRNLNSKVNRHHPNKKIKTTRKVNFGWKHANSLNARHYTMVSLAKGGGTCIVDVDRDKTRSEVLQLAKDLYFPNGKANIKNLDEKDCSFFIANFNGNEIGENLTNGKEFTIANYFECLKTTPQRIYLHSRPNLLDTSNQETTQSNNSPTHTIESQPSCSSNHCLEMYEGLSSDEDLPDINPVPIYSGTPTIEFNRHKCLTKPSEDNKKESLEDILSRMYAQRNTDNGKKNIINVDREDVLRAGRRAFANKTFHPERGLSVRFSGEQGIDNGGPSREFYRLAMCQIRDSPIFQGEMNEKVLCPDINCEQKGYYEIYGRMIAYFFVHGAPSPAFFSNLMFNLVAYGLHEKPSVNDIVDNELRTQILTFLEAKNSLDYFKAIEPLIPIIDFIGAMALSTKFDRKEKLAEVLCQHIVIHRITEVLHQFTKGLNCLGVLDEIKKNPEVLRQVFVDIKKTKLEPDDVDALFLPVFSDEGSNDYRKELRTQTNWRDLLQDLGEDTGGLESLLIFVTGFSKIPPLGFDPCLSLSFKHPINDADTSPYANTCSHNLAIPVIEEYEDFRKVMLTALQLGLTFTNL